jgi:hypothetical protein
MCPENYWSIRHCVLPFSADPRTADRRTGRLERRVHAFHHQHRGCNMQRYGV